MTVTFTKATDSYMSFISNTYQYYVQNSTATFHMHELLEPEMRALIFFDDSRYCTLVVLSDGVPRGYATLKGWSEREAYSGTAEVSIYLMPGFTGQGIGTQTIRFMEEIARTNGLHALLASICAENEPSIRLFERNGFIKCAHFREVGRKFGRLLDVVDYEKIIG